MATNNEEPKQPPAQKNEQEIKPQKRESVSIPQRSVSIATPNAGPWFHVSATPKDSSAVVVKHHPPPVRSISTFNFQDLKDQISPAAPFPSIPTKQEVQNAKNEIENEITQLKAELSSLLYEKKSLEMQKAPRLDPLTTTKDGVHIFRGMVMTDTQINDIIKDNREKSKRSTKRALIDPCEDESMNALHKLPKYRHLVDLPQFKKTIEDHTQLLTPIYAAKYAEKDVLLEHEDELAEEYLGLDGPWQQKQKVIDEYNDRTSEKSENWPSEFKFERPNLDDAARLKWAAQDTPMILSRQQQIDRCYFDTNSLVNDPVQEYKDYKQRLSWTEEEKKIFVEKYTMHPKDFSFIADALPDKTIKEVIEFYYLNRYHMNLKENEGAARRRGGKKKVVTEGSKKNY